ncbi:transcription factor GTE3, chloroplastic isoform X2 [Jatropha curcas]|uniref:transcription factor GTE3, chloroplastic isoform X2 n=1 Tax=Jatropha curcas TaxID=180498 RepID=UPI0005FAF1AE|nr:transcription factor GTE3, chloroplastic isoform X2 [Jatropha curcas]
MATGPIFAGGGDSRGKKQKWIDTNNSSKKMYAQKLHNKSKNPTHIPHPEQFSPGGEEYNKNSYYSSQQPKQQKRFNTVASDHSSSHNRLQPGPQNDRTGNSLSGYVKFDNKVRISLNDRSKSVIRELKRKLVSELDQVRSLKRKLEANQIQYGGYNYNGMIGGDDGTGGGYSNKNSTLARVNSEVSYVGPSDPQPLQGLANDYGGDGENVKKESKTSKVNQHHKNPPVSVIRKEKTSNLETKKLKQCSGEKKVGRGKVTELDSNMDRYNREIFKKCEDLLGKLMNHQYGWVFNEPVNVKKLKLHDYYKIIKHPMDLGTVKSRLQKNWYKSPKEFAEDVRLTFNNAMTYNEKGQDVHIMAGTLFRLFEEKWTVMKGKFNCDERHDIGHDTSFPKQASKRAPALAPAPAPAPPSPNRSPPPLKMPLERRNLDRSESMAKPLVSNLEGTNIVTHEGKTPMSKKTEPKDPEKREMTFEEKQRLSMDLLNLPSEKLDSVVQIIKKRNPGLCQQEDEIEVDIDSFDIDTLWELDRLVTNYKKNLSQNKRESETTCHEREEAGHNYQEANQISTAAGAPEESKAEDFAVCSPNRAEKQGDNASKSSSSGCSSSDSGSSSSDSEGDSGSGYGSDAGQ